MSPLPSGLSTRPESLVPSGDSHLRLQRAIESLALNLDDELQRYRRSRSGSSALPAAPARLQLRQNRKPIDLIALKATTAAPPPPNARLQELLGQSSEPKVQAYPPKTTVNQVRLSHGGTLTTYRAAPDDYLESTEALLGSLPQPSSTEDDEPSLLRQLTSPLGLGALLLLLVGSAGFGYLVTSPQAVRHLTEHPIAQRLRGEQTPIASDEPLTNAEPEGATDGGFQPIGPDLSDQEFASLDLNRISTLPSTGSTSSSSDFSTAPTAGVLRPADNTATGQLGPARASSSTPVGPEALRAAVVTSPGRSVSRQPITAQPSAVAPSQPARVSPTTAPARSQPAAQFVAPPAATARPPQPLAVSRTSPALATPPAPLTAPAARAPVAPPAPITQAPPAAPPSYYVVTDYSGAQSLEAARGAVGDAYVRNFSSGTRIQMGAFSQPSSAQNLVNELQGQGIPAQVITP